MLEFPAFLDDRGAAVLAGTNPLEVRKLDAATAKPSFAFSDIAFLVEAQKGIGTARIYRFIKKMATEQQNSRQLPR